MIFEFLSMLMMQTPAGGDLPPTRRIDPYALCACPQADDQQRVNFTGYATDAELTLGEDGRSAEARQATIFRVTKGRSAEIPEFAKVWHVTNPAKCGVKFDYGRRYDVTAIRRDDGALETNWCEMGKTTAAR